MKKTGLLNQPLSTVIAGLGHMDTLCVADAGLPIPSSTHRIDLAVTDGVPGFLAVLDAILGEMQVEGAVIAQEMATVSPQMHMAIMERLTDIDVRVVLHEDFKQETTNSVAIARTGEFTPYANVILIAGVVF